MKDYIPIYNTWKRLLIPRSLNEMNLINEYIEWDMWMNVDINAYIEPPNN